MNIDNTSYLLPFAEEPETFMAEIYDRQSIVTPHKAGTQETATDSEVLCRRGPPSNSRMIVQPVASIPDVTDDSQHNLGMFNINTSLSSKGVSQSHCRKLNKNITNLAPGKVFLNSFYIAPSKKWTSEV